jgi:hypothetical protein
MKKGSKAAAFFLLTLAKTTRTQWIEFSKK